MNYFYSLQHHWILLFGKRAKLGLTQVVVREVGQVIYVDLPKVNERLEEDGLLCVLESSKAAMEILSPIAGRVIKVNSLLIDHPSLINESCQQKGWIVEMEIEKPSQLQSLMDEKSYLKSFG